MDVKVGDKIRILYMQGEPQYAYKEGYVRLIDDAGQIHGSWGGCAIVPEFDQYEIIEQVKDSFYKGKENL